MFWNIILIFLSAGILGWFLEVFYRGIAVEKKIINPGFLNGTYLPIYGWAAIILFFVSSLDIALPLKLGILVLFPTVLELLTGLFFRSFYKVKLWDYSSDYFNYKGLICPLFSMYWAGIAVAFYYFIFPLLNQLLSRPKSLALIFCMGILLGIMIVDAWISFGFVKKIKRMIVEFNKNNKAKTLLDYKLFKIKLARQLKGSQDKFKNYLDPLHSVSKEKIMEFLRKYNK